MFRAGSLRLVAECGPTLDGVSLGPTPMRPSSPRPMGSRLASTGSRSIESHEGRSPGLDEWPRMRCGAGASTSGVGRLGRVPSLGASIPGDQRID
jgi:hypothetical protein